MIATRSSKEEQREEEIELLSADNGLFAGLNFPSVPTAPISVQTSVDVKTDNICQKTVDETSGLLSSAAVEEQLLELEENLPIIRSDAGSKELTASILIDSSKSIQYGNKHVEVSTNDSNGDKLSALYEAPDVHSNAKSLYPDLPNLDSRSLPTVESRSISTTSSIQQYQNLDTVPATATTSATEPSMSSDGGVDAALLDDLMRENQRLNDEIANLKNMVSEQARLQAEARSQYAAAQQQQQQLPQASYYQPTAAAVQQQPVAQMRQAPTSAPAVANTVTPQQRAIQLQEEALRNYTQQHTEAGEASVGNPVSDTSRPPQQGVKYVCCGGCRRWMSAAKESVYVVCPNCDGINNCNLAPKSNAAAAANQQIDRRALTTQSVQSQPSIIPWFLDCFSRPMNDQS